MRDTLGNRTDGCGLASVTEALLKPYVFVKHFLQAQLGMYTGEGFVEIDRLGNVVDRASIETFELSFLRGFGCNEYDGYGLGRWVRLEALTDLNAVHLWHHNVEQNEVRICLLDDV